ncbi:hypothetical protein Goshw_008587 [Gossypium schwendimanii]|uniref:Uncharacterized protein n=1 Tax=Gossypium schwendimanii TaxID=34291 RepID=A0A7J9N0Y4_GOSSC|nr:hypothetical protein [Gossypium schwendimanii]
MCFVFFQDLVLLLLTSGGDPGIISRNAHPPGPEGFDGNVDVGAVQTHSYDCHALNKWRAKVPREPVLPTRPGDFMSPNMGNVVGDIEMGRKGECVNVKEDKLGELTPETSTADDMGDHAGIHPRRSNWGRKSGSWEMSSEVVSLAARVGDSNRAVGSSSRSLAT